MWYLSKITFTGSESAISELVKHYNKSPYGTNISREKNSFFNTLFYRPSSLFSHPDAPNDSTLRSKLNEDLLVYNIENLGCSLVGLGYLEKRDTELATIGLFTRYNTPLIGLARIANIPEYSDVTIEVSYHRVPTSSQSEINNYPSGFYQLKNGRCYSERQEDQGQKITKEETLEYLLTNHQKFGDNNRNYLFFDKSKYVRGSSIWRKDLDFEGTIFEKTHQQIQALPTCLKILHSSEWLFIINYCVLSREDREPLSFYHGEIVYQRFDNQGDEDYNLFLNRQFTLDHVFKSLKIEPDFVAKNSTQIIKKMESLATKLTPLVVNLLKLRELEEEYANLQSKLNSK